MAFVAFVVAFPLAAPLAGAQDAGAGTLFFTAVPATGGPAPANPCLNNAYEMQPAIGEDSKAYFGPSTPASGCSTHFLFVATSPFSFAGDATATAYLSCDSPVYVGTPVTVTHRIQLYKNSELLSQTDFGGGSVACTGSGTVQEFVGEGLGTEDESFGVGDLLRITFIIWTTGAAEGAEPSYHFLVGPTHPSRLDAPGLAMGAGSGEGPAGIVHENLTGTAAVVEHTFVNATDATYLYNWTSDNGTLGLVANATVLSGSANLTIIDGANETVVDEVFRANGTLDMPVKGMAGNWTLRIAYQNFTGNLTLELAASSGGEGDSSTNATSSVQPSSGTEDRTGSFPLQYEKDTPVPGAVPVSLVVLGLAFALFRRRLD